MTILCLAQSICLKKCLINCQLQVSWHSRRDFLGLPWRKWRVIILIAKLIDYGWQQNQCPNQYLFVSLNYHVTLCLELNYTPLIFQTKKQSLRDQGTCPRVIQLIRHGCQQLFAWYLSSYVPCLLKAKCKNCIMFYLVTLFERVPSLFCFQLNYSHYLNSALVLSKALRTHPNF